MKKDIVIGLDILLSMPSFLDPDNPLQQKYGQIFIPRAYIAKLIELRQENPEDDRYNLLLKKLSKITRFSPMQATTEKDQVSANTTARPDYPKINLCDTCNTNPLVTEEHSNPLAYCNDQWHEYQALKYALCRQSRKAPVVILTNNPGLEALAASLDLKTQHLKIDHYAGRRNVKINFNIADTVSALPCIKMEKWQEIFPDEPALRANEFVVLDQYGQKTYWRFDAESSTLLPLLQWKYRPPIIQYIQPRSPGQTMLYDALLTPPEETPIVIASGEFGTGKTFLTVAAAYAGVLSGQYERIIICPRDARLGDDIGAVPGETYDKARTKARSIEDSLSSLIRTIDQQNNKSSDENYNLRLAEKVEEELARYFEFVPLVEVSGRSFSHAFIICDEFQDTTKVQARELITRLGDHSKLVLLGDLKQINSPKLTHYNNGLSYAISRIAGKPEVAYVSFLQQESTRHPATKALAEYLS